LEANGLPVLFNGTSWNSIVTNDLQGASFAYLGEFNNLDQFVGGMFNVPNTPPGYYVGFFASPVAVPERTSITLFRIGSIGLLFLRKRASRTA